MVKEKANSVAANLESYYTQPNNLVDLFENSAAKFASRNLFGTKNKETNQYEWVTFAQVAGRINNLRGALKKIGFEIKYIGSVDGIEKEIITQNNIS